MYFGCQKSDSKSDLQRLSNLTLNPVDTRLKSSNPKEWKDWAVVLIFNWNNFSEHSVSSTWGTQAWKTILVVLPGDLFLVHMHFAIEVQWVKYLNYNFHKREPNLGHLKLFEPTCGP
jgi:hypothetical protein